MARPLIFYRALSLARPLILLQAITPCKNCDPATRDQHAASKTLVATLNALCKTIQLGHRVSRHRYYNGHQVLVASDSSGAYVNLSFVTVTRFNGSTVMFNASISMQRPRHVLYGLF